MKRRRGEKSGWRIKDKGEVRKGNSRIAIEDKDKGEYGGKSSKKREME